MKEKKRRLHFSGRTHSKKGIASTVMAGIAWILFIALCVNSAGAGGNASLTVGVLGILDVFFCIAGMVTAFKGFRERDVFYVFPGIGMGCNGVLAVIYIILYFMGMAVA